VATGYGDQRRARSDRGEERRPRSWEHSLREPPGEPRVSRMSRPAERERREPSRMEVDVPEYIPRY